MPGNARQFQESITQELDSIKNRVRNLIGHAHWGEEGRYKEAVLKNILRKFLPKNLSVGTGFILRADGENDDENLLSCQLDVIVYDNTRPLLFSEGDFIITTLSSVKAIIEVKSRIRDNSLTNVIQQFDYSLRYFNRETNLNRSVFAGIFAFEFDGNIHSDRIESALRDSQHIVNHISLGTNFFIKRWRHKDAIRLGGNITCPGDFYNIYEIQGLSFSYFISNLLHTVCGGLEDRYWYSFPIQGTKETNRIDSICF